MLVLSSNVALLVAVFVCVYAEEEEEVVQQEGRLSFAAHAYEYTRAECVVVVAAATIVVVVVVVVVVVLVVD